MQYEDLAHEHLVAALQALVLENGRLRNELSVFKSREILLADATIEALQNQLNARARSYPRAERKWYNAHEEEFDTFIDQQLDRPDIRAIPDAQDVTNLVTQLFKQKLQRESRLCTCDFCTDDS